jgi:protein involved in polysaccharide export with SLBB domain
MKSLTLFCTVTAFLSLAWHSSADTASDATDTVPAPKFYFVGGDGVKTPGRFLYRAGITLTNAVSLAGGYDKLALKTKVEIIRKGQGAAFVVNVANIEAGKTNDFAIEPDDYVYVRRAKTIKLHDSDTRGH